MSLARISQLKTKIGNIPIKINATLENIQFPEKYKGTILERWAKYWKQLGIDYYDVFQTVGKDVREKPLKAGILASIGFGAYLCGRNNPDESLFLTNLKKYNHQLALVAEECRRPDTTEHLRFVEQCYNQGLIRRLSLGVVSFIWVHNYDEYVAMYKATCPYLQPQYLTFNQRIIDIGFWNKWMKLDEVMIDYDVNEAT